MSAPATTTPRSRRGMLGLLTANTFSLAGTRLSQIALPWFVITTTGSPAQTGLAAFALMGPYVLAKGLGGPIIDRLGPRRVIVATESAAAATADSLRLGDSDQSTAVLFLQNGGMLTTVGEPSFIGSGAGSLGIVSISGGSSWNNASTTVIGF
jgi:nitrate/nitrite transporter NarK